MAKSQKLKGKKSKGKKVPLLLGAVVGFALLFLVMPTEASVAQEMADRLRASDEALGI